MLGELVLLARDVTCPLVHPITKVIVKVLKPWKQLLEVFWEVIRAFVESLNLGE